MQLDYDLTDNVNRITHYDDTYIAVNGQRYAQSLLVTPTRIDTTWSPQDFATLCVADMAYICQLQPELVLIGCGTQQRFLPAPLLRPLIEAQVGFEVMSTGAACRTYNVLAAERRHVVAALLLG